MDQNAFSYIDQEQSENDMPKVIVWLIFALIVGSLIGFAIA